MARRRMISLDISDNEPFISCSRGARYLYYELVLRADDEGFIGGVSRILRTVECSNEELHELISCGLVIEFPSKVLVITDWLLFNRVQATRKNETIYQSEKAMLSVLNESKYIMSTSCQQDADAVECSPGQDSSDKHSGEADSVGEVNEGEYEGEPLEPDLYAPQSDLELNALFELKKKERADYKKQGGIAAGHKPAADI